MVGYGLRPALLSQVLDLIPVVAYSLWTDNDQFEPQEPLCVFFVVFSAFCF